MSSPVFFDDNKIFTSLSEGENIKHDHWIVAWIEYDIVSPFAFNGAVLIKQAQTCYWPDTTINNEYKIVGLPTFGHPLTDLVPFQAHWRPASLGPPKCPCSCNAEGETWASFEIPINYSGLDNIIYGGHYFEYIRYLSNISSITSQGFDGPIGPTQSPIDDTYRLLTTDIDADAIPATGGTIQDYLIARFNPASLESGYPNTIANNLIALADNIDTTIFISDEDLFARRAQIYENAGYSLVAGGNTTSDCCGAVVDQLFPPYTQDSADLYCFNCDQNLFPHILQYPDPGLPSGVIEATFFVADCDPIGSVTANGVEPFSTYFSMHDRCINGLVRSDMCLLDHLRGCTNGGLLTAIAEYGFTINGQLCGYRSWGELDGDPDICPCQNTVLPSGTVIEFTYTSYCDNNEFVPCDQICPNSAYSVETGSETLPWLADCADPVSYVTDGTQAFGNYFRSVSSCANGYDGQIYSLYNFCVGSEWVGVGGFEGKFRLWSVNGSSCLYRPDGAKANGNPDDGCPCMSEILPSGITLRFIGEGTCNNPHEDLDTLSPDCHACLQE
jgi:hypothetical protein